MHQSSNHSKFQRMRRRLDLFRQKKEEQSVSHPLRACLPFLCATGVLMTTVVTAASCTLCYRVDAQGQSLAFFHDVATYDAAVSQAETRASKILETQYSLNQDLSVRATLAPKDQIESLSGVTGSLMESIPELEHVYTLSVDGTMVGAAQDPSVITQALNLVKERYTTPETRSLHIDSQVDIRYQYLPADTGESTAEEMAAALLAQYQGFADVNSGRGAIVIGLAAVIIGEVLFSKVFRNFALKLLAVVFGSLIYYLVYQVVILLGLKSDDMKLITALIVALFLAVPYWKGRYFTKRTGKGAGSHA